MFRERVEAVLRRWGLPCRPEVVNDLCALYSAAEQEEPMGASLARARASVSEVLARRAPPGAQLDDATIADVKREVGEVLHRELLASGMPAAQAQLARALLLASVTLTRRP